MARSSSATDWISPFRFSALRFDIVGCEENAVASNEPRENQQSLSHCLFKVQPICPLSLTTTLPSSVPDDRLQQVKRAVSKISGEKSCVFAQRQRSFAVARNIEFPKSPLDGCSDLLPT